MKNMMNKEDLRCDSKHVVGFPDLGFHSKNLCVMCVCHCVFSIFIKNMFAVINCTRLTSTFGVRAIIGFKWTPL
jgi:hypothetical protein